MKSGTWIPKTHTRAHLQAQVGLISRAEWRCAGGREGWGRGGGRRWASPLRSELCQLLQLQVHVPAVHHSYRERRRENKPRRKLTRWTHWLWSGSRWELAWACTHTNKCRGTYETRDSTGVWVYLECVFFFFNSLILPWRTSFPTDMLFGWNHFISIEKIQLQKWWHSYRQRDICSRATRIGRTINLPAHTEAKWLPIHYTRGE